MIFTPINFKSNKSRSQSKIKQQHQNIYKHYNFIQKISSQMNNSQKQLVKNFLEFTGTSQQIAQRFLTREKWNFQNALNRFYDEGAPMPQPQKVTTLAEVQKFFQQNSVVENERRIINDEDVIARLFQQILHINMESIVIGHMMLNVMEMKKAGIVQKQNLYNIFQYTKSRSFKEVASKIKDLEKQIYDRKDLFRKMYEGFYQFFSVSKSPTLEFEVALNIWTIYLKHIMTYHKQFIEYLNSLEKKNKVHRDLWKMTYEFAITVHKVSQYKQEDGWPVVLDDFVAYLKQKNIN